MATTAPAARTGPARQGITASIFQQDKYSIRATRFGRSATLSVIDSSGASLAFLQHKSISPRDEIRVFTDQTRSLELLRMEPRQDASCEPSFKITDILNRETAGMLKRRSWKASLREEWVMMDCSGNEIGLLHEPSQLRAFLRRYLLRIVPLRVVFELHGEPGGAAQENWSVFPRTLRMDVPAQAAERSERCLLLAGVLLVLMGY